jgi:hypothetical protein
MITANCRNPRCFINGQFNEGNCKCECNIDKLSIETLLGLIEDGEIACDTLDEAKIVVKKIEHLSFNKYTYKVINNFLQAHKKAGV